MGRTSARVIWTLNSRWGSARARRRLRRPHFIKWVPRSLRATAHLLFFDPAALRNEGGTRSRTPSRDRSPHLSAFRIIGWAIRAARHSFQGPTPSTEALGTPLSSPPPSSSSYSPLASLLTTTTTHDVLHDLPLSPLVHNVFSAGSRRPVNARQTSETRLPSRLHHEIPSGESF